MSITVQRFTKVIVPIVNAALARGLIDKTMPWLPLAIERFVRLVDVIDGDIPVVVDVGRWQNGLSHIRWALWPKSLDVSLESPVYCYERPLYSYEWPGEVWGWGTIDRRWDLALDAFGEFHCRQPRHARIDAITRASLDGRMTTRL